MKNKSLLIGALFPVLVFILCAAVPSLTDFNLNQFDVTTRKVALRNGVLTTNLVEQTAFTVLGSPSGTNIFGGATNWFASDVGIGGSIYGTSNILTGLGSIAYYPALSFTSSDTFLPIIGVGFVESNSPPAWESALGLVANTDGGILSRVYTLGQVQGNTNLQSVLGVDTSGSNNNAGVRIEAKQQDVNIALARIVLGDTSWAPQVWLRTVTAGSDAGLPLGVFIGDEGAPVLSQIAGFSGDGNLYATNHAMIGSTNQWKFLSLTDDGGTTNVHVNINGTNFQWQVIPMP